MPSITTNGRDKGLEHNASVLGPRHDAASAVISQRIGAVLTILKDSTDRDIASGMRERAVVQLKKAADSSELSSFGSEGDVAKEVRAKLVGGLVNILKAPKDLLTYEATRDVVVHTIAKGVDEVAKDMIEGISDKAESTEFAGKAIKIMLHAAQKVAFEVEGDKSKSRLQVITTGINVLRSRSIEKEDTTVAKQTPSIDTVAYREDVNALRDMFRKAA